MTVRRMLADAALGAAAAAALGSAALAHHSYAAFDRSTLVTIEGTLESVAWSNPHVVLVLKTEGGDDYRVEWANLNRLERAGLRADTFAIGDRLVVSGAAHRDPEERVLTLLVSVERPADGWSWARGRPLESPVRPGSGRPNGS